jgi:hypothetical protein
MAFKAIVIFLVIAILMEDGSSMRKKTEEEEKEEKEIAERVNATLAEEEEKERLEEEEKKKRQDQGKKGQDQEKEKKTSSTEKEKCLDEAGSTPNCTCPEVRPCPKVKECGPCKACESSVDCLPTKECGPCEICKSSEDCPPVKDCEPCPPIHCDPCPVSNITEQVPPICQCSEGSRSMTVPVAMAVGAVATLTITGVATVIGLLLRYAPPIISGSLFVCIVLMTWFLSSRYPEVAREAGERVVAVLREATVALGHRIMEAIRHHNEQVSFPVLNLFLLPNLSSMFSFESLH